MNCWHCGGKGTQRRYPPLEPVKCSACKGTGVASSDRYVVTQRHSNLYADMGYEYAVLDTKFQEEVQIKWCDDKNIPEAICRVLNNTPNEQEETIRRQALVIDDLEAANRRLGTYTDKVIEQVGWYSAWINDSGNRKEYNEWFAEVSELDNELRSES